MRRLVLASSIVLGAAAGVVLTRRMLGGAQRRPRHELLERRAGLEIRAYGPRVQAQVTVVGPYEDALARGCGILARYLHGENGPEEEVGAKGPVTASAAGQRIAARAPICATDLGGRWTIGFTMPPGRTCDDLPEPRDPRIRLIALPAGAWAALPFSGRADRVRVERMCHEMRDRLRRAELRGSGEVIVAQYSAPGVPAFAQRNEILVPLASTLPEQRDLVPDGLLPV